MDVTSDFVLDYVRQFARGAGKPADCAILDFGCGAGQLVAEARATGLNMQGADVYYQGSGTRAEAVAAGLLGTAVHETRDAGLPFPDAAFDLVVNNQVLEHVQDLDRELAEIHRVLKPGGTLLSIFPSSDVCREGHIGIPFAHWFRRGSRYRFLFVWALRSMGFGYWKQQAPTGRQWAIDKLAWIDAYVRYRPRAEIRHTFERYFRSEGREADYIRYRLCRRRWRAPAARLLSLPPARAAAISLFRKLAFLVIESRKEDR